MKNKSVLLQGILFLVLGILLCVGISGNEVLGWLLSISMLVSGAALVTVGAIMEKTLVGNNGYSGAILITLGLALMPVRGLCLFASYFQLISLLMIVIGALYLVDALCGFIGKRALIGNVFMLVLGALLLTFGFLLWFDVGGMMQYASLILGIAFIIYAVLLLVSALSNKNILVIKLKK